VQPKNGLHHTIRNHSKERTMSSSKQNPRDKQPGETGKVANDANKLGEQEPTQKNQGKRTPESRSDRESQIGSSNQSQARRGATSGH
jgi:hypothetical protein